MYRTNPEAADELVRISNELQVVQDLLFPSIERSKASVAGFMCNIDNTSEIVRMSKLQSERDTDFEFDNFQLIWKAIPRSMSVPSSARPMMLRFMLQRK